MFTVVIKFVDVASRPNGKQFKTTVSEVNKETKGKAWKLVLDTQKKAANTPTIALVDIEVRSEDGKVIWSLH